VNIKQIGHAIIHVDKYDEDYLIPLPDVKISGLLTGTAYPELTGSYEIISSAGYIATMDFSGTKMLGLGGDKNHVSAAVFDEKDVERSSPLYTVDGSWSGTFTIREEGAGTIDTYDSSVNEPSPITVASVEHQDPWESRRAWGGTIKALDSGQMQAAANEKSKVEQGQRNMRLEEEQKRSEWKPVFFTNVQSDPRFSKLKNSTDSEYEFGFWKFDQANGEGNKQAPFHDGLIPTNEKSDSQEGQEEDQSSIRKPVSEGAELNKVSNSTTKEKKTKSGANTSPYSAKPLDPRVDRKLP
jgi:hypothetical protein